MKIICIGMNYASHVKEMGLSTPETLQYFMKPDSSLLLLNRPFYYPDFSTEIEYEAELVIKIDRLGKNIQKKFASGYYSQISLGIDFTARDLQREAMLKGLPWEKAKAFDASAVLGSWIGKNRYGDMNDISFELHKNGDRVQYGHTGDMIYSIDEIISYVSRFVTLKIGDLIYTGTPSGVGGISIGDRLQGFLGGEELIDMRIK